MSDAASAPDFRAREIRLWWPVPLAAILWLAVMWKFGDFLSSPLIETVATAPIEASFVELPEVAPKKSPEPQPKSVPKKAKPKIKPRPDALPSPVVAPSVPTAPADPEPVLDMVPPTDMLSYVNAARARRRAAEMSAERENAQAASREHGPSPDEVRMANIMRNLKPQSTNGVFQLVSVGVRSAKYSFRGWTKDAGNARRELIEVDVGPNGNVERAIVRSMIALIRKYYQGDFNWDSQRLGRVIVLSARMEDNAGLEEFLIREFFGADALAAEQRIVP